MSERLPLPTLLSFALVAFTIELDNEFEHRMPHRVTRQKSLEARKERPWLGSMALWFNCMRFVTPDGITLGGLQERTLTDLNFDGMERWGYIDVDPPRSERRPKPPRPGWVLYPTSGGEKAREMWTGLLPEIETRWRERFGEDQIATLREALGQLAGQFEHELPDCMPILGYGLRCSKPLVLREPIAPIEAVALPSLLSKCLLAYALAFEKSSKLSLAIGADFLRLFEREDLVPVRQMPQLSGVSKEAIAVILSFIAKQGYAQLRPEAPGSRFKAVCLTEAGLSARASYHETLRQVEEGFGKRFGGQTVSALREALEPLICNPALFQGMEPYPDGWRAFEPKRETLPHFPMVTHRGCYPDGA